MLTLQGVRKKFGGLPVLDDIGFVVGDGEIVAVLGPSGCGKSTLLNIVAGFEREDGGTVDAGGARIGYVFQEDRLLPWRTLEENIALVRETEDRGEVERLIALLGLEGFGSYYPDALSGGMRQRCSIARAYHYQCDLLLMDEPFKSLDHHLRVEMLELLMKVWRAKRTAILFTTHDLDEALAVAARIVVLSRRPARVVREFSLGGAEVPRDVLSDDLLEIKRQVIGALA